MSRAQRVASYSENLMNLPLHSSRSIYGFRLTAFSSLTQKFDGASVLWAALLLHAYVHGVMMWLELRSIYLLSLLLFTLGPKATITVDVMQVIA